MKKLELIVMQSTSFCNLNCKYCYVPDRKHNNFMGDVILEAAAKIILSSDMVMEKPMFLWHAGEPLTVGVGYYENAIKVIEKYNIKQKVISHSVQTNATLINDKWCKFFKENNFKVGVSLDGPEFLNDRNRVRWNNKGSFASVMKGVDFLRKHEIPLAAICVVTLETLKYPDEVFNFFLDSGFTRLSFVLEDIVGENTNTTFSTIDQSRLNEITELYNAFFSRIIDLWIKYRKQIYVRELEEFLEIIYKAKKNSEFYPISQEVLEFGILTVQNNGNVSTYCPELAGGTQNNRDQFVIGNVLTLQNLNALLTSNNHLRMKKEIDEGIKNCKDSCSYFKLCGGRSPSHKVYENGSFASTKTIHCSLQKISLGNILLNKLPSLLKEYA